jgi:hypothetical protein
MTTSTLYKLDDATLHGEYVKALFNPLKAFLLQKKQGHCQRIDYLPKSVMEGLGEKLSSDPDLVGQKISCRVVTDRSGALKLWEVSGSGAVKLREDATYGRIKVLCALFPSGLRLAEEDSLNVTTFKTDDAESFDAGTCLEQHLTGKVNLLPQDEKEILWAILNHDEIRRRPVQNRLRYVLSVLGQKMQCSKSINWESAGAYLYELGLVPDFGLDGGIFRVQLARNSRCVNILLDGEKSLAMNLHRLVTEAEMDDEERRRNLMVYLADKNVLRTSEWVEPICHNENLRKKLSFDEWHFAQPVTGVHIELKPLQDPKKPEKVASGLIFKDGVLVNDGKKAIHISWQVTPPEAQELGRILVTVIRKTQDQGEVDVIPPQYVAAKRKSFSVPMAENNLDEDEKCVAVIRIQGLSKTGVPIPEAGDESEDFWVEKGADIEVVPPEKSQRIQHLDEVLFRVVYETGTEYGVRSRGWDPKREHVYSVRLTNNRRGDLWLNPMLRDLERKILENPETLGIYQANLVNRRRAHLDDFKLIGLSAAVNSLANDFYKAREAFFVAVRDHEGGRGVVEVTNLHDLQAEAMLYVERYLDLLKGLKSKIENTTGMGGINTVLHDYASILRIDTVMMQAGPADRPMRILLLSPTHPLRVLWLYQFETLVCGWIDRMKGKKSEEIKLLIDEDVLAKLTSLNVPSAISVAKGEVFINTDNHGLFWSIFPDANTPDLRTAVNAALQVLGAETEGGVISTVSPKQIADKMERYLCHHPYVQTLKLNVVNPGDGRLILEAIKLLLGKEPYRELNFDLKFFSPAGTRHQLVGNAFDDFMAQKSIDDWSGGRTLSETEEILLSPNPNPLFPKLIYAKHEIGDLLQDQEGRFDAHLTFVIDFFGTTVCTREFTGPRGSSSLHNLLSEYVTDFVPGQTTATWSRMIAPDKCPDLVSDGNTAKLHEAQDLLGHLAACLFDWSDSFKKFVTIQLELTDEPNKAHLQMLDRVHQTSDWVFTIDRNFGIEFYDNPIKGLGTGNGGYLIDYTPEFLDAVAHRLIISTFHQHEIESILRGGFVQLLVDNPEEAGEVLDAAKIAQVLQVLKSVSGKLALKLINNPNQAQEVIGLALTRLSLEQEGRLTGRVLIPVDSHLNLFYQTPAELLNGELTLKRTDLMLLELRNQRMHIDLIEVKNRKASSPAAIYELQEEIRAKNKNTEAHFRFHFLGSERIRLDAAIKSKELANILSFYFERAMRYGLFAQGLGETEANARREEFIGGLGAVVAGECETDFGHEGYIFNGSSWGDVDQQEVHGNVIKLFGRQGISSLLHVSLDEGEQEAQEPEGAEAPSTGSELGSQPAKEPTTDTEPEVGARAYETTSQGEPIPQRTKEQTYGPSATQQPSDQLLPELGITPEAAGTESADVRIAETRLRVFLGKDTTTKKDLFWDPQIMVPKRLLNQHLLIVGKSGSGKSQTTKSVLYELDRQGVPSIILDFQGEYASGEFRDVIEPQVFDVMDGLPINPFEIPVDPQTGKKRRPVEMMFRLADTINSVFAGSGDIQLGKLREAIKECYLQAGFDMNLPAPDDREPPTLEMLAGILEKWSAATGGAIRNLQVRLQPVFESGIFELGRALYSFEDLFKKTTVVLLTSGIKDLMLAASRFLLEKIYGAMLIQGMSKSLRVMVCVDEAHKLCNDPKITDLVKEARKYGLGLILSSQETRDFHPSIFANAGTQIVLALEDSDATIMAKHFTPDKNDQKRVKELIMCQESGVALIRSTHFQPYAQVRIRPFEERTGWAERNFK